MVKIMENPIKMDDLWGFPPIFGSTPSWSSKIRKGRFNPEDQSVSYLLLGVILGALGFIIAVPAVEAVGTGR